MRLRSARGRLPVRPARLVKVRALVVPVQLGYKNVKWVTRLEVTDKARAGYWEQRGYPEAAPIPEG